MTLKIRHEQFAVFEAESRKSFCRRMVLHLREIFGDQVATEDDVALADWVLSTSRQLEAFEIVLETDVELYLELAVCHPDELRRAPLLVWIFDILNHPGRTPAQRLDLLREDLIFGRTPSFATAAGGG